MSDQSRIALTKGGVSLSRLVFGAKDGRCGTAIPDLPTI
jgi:hypothetical protein